MDSKILGNRYELLERIGMGGMAVVYKATDKVLGRNVAVKILREEYKENEEFIRRFKVESQSAACLSHQNIVQIYDVGEEDGIHYIIMELLEGETLKSYITSKGGKLPYREALNYSMQICRALEHAHSKDVVHRDIKPQNIVLTPDGKIKVADFGIARIASGSTIDNASGYAVGSAHYLSPEQARGSYTDHRSDIYSLGVVMYELFTGKLPFDGEESIGIAMKHLQEEPPLPSDIDPEIPLGIEAIILRAMCKEQAHRYENASQILKDLVTVYQKPSVDIALLNAYVEDSDRNPPRRSVVKKTTPRNTKSKKEPSKKGLIIAAASILSVLVIVFGIALWILLFGTGHEVEIPSLIGLTYEEASSVAENASKGDIEFEVFVEKRAHSDEEKNTIISQTPEGGLKIKRSREIKVTISLGPVALELDDYTGMNYRSVSKELEEKGIKVIIEQEDNDTYEEGKIFKQFPSEGTKMSEDDEITLYVSKGTENTVVPDVVGKTLDEAIITIERNNLRANVIKEPHNKYLKDEVFKQSHKAFKTVPVDTVIDIYVSTGKDAQGEEDGTSSTENTSSSNKPGKLSVKLTGLSKSEPTKVKLIVDGARVFEGDVPTTTGAATISFEVDASLDLTHGVDIYYNGAYRTTKEVK